MLFKKIMTVDEAKRANKVIAGVMVLYAIAIGLLKLFTGAANYTSWSDFLTMNVFSILVLLLAYFVFKYQSKFIVWILFLIALPPTFLVLNTFTFGLPFLLTEGNMGKAISDPVLLSSLLTVLVFLWAGFRSWSAYKVLRNTAG